MCPQSHCKAAAGPSLNPRTPVPGLCRASHMAHCVVAGRPAAVRSRRYSLVSTQNSQALGGQDVVSAVAHLYVLRGFGVRLVFKYPQWVWLPSSVRLITPEKGVHFLMQTSACRE